MSKEPLEKEVRQWMHKIEEVKKGEVDLSRDEDLSIALMNLISLEEHFYFTAMKTENRKYLDMLDAVRTLRKSLLKKIVTDPQGEEWCISKHLLAASMRLMEVGTKELGKGNRKDAEKLFSSGFELWSLFFAINLKMVGTEQLGSTDRKAAKPETARVSESIGKDAKSIGKQNSVSQKFSSIIKKIVDCCRE